ncbi:hypothetical protein ACFVTZ_13575 [Cellulosimicrobium cellulans]|uniref:hypothetical protein n=1 Tax=Cellulosimicrobium cellulans TaxID=1710 RepID=UPI0036E1899A
MPSKKHSLMSRIGAAFEAGAPLGASIGIAKVTRDQDQAAAAGRLAQPSSFFGVQQPQQYTFQERVDQKPLQDAFQENKRFIAANPQLKSDGAGNWLLEAMGAPVRWTGDYYGAAFRYQTDQMTQGGPANALQSLGAVLPGFAFTDSEFRENYWSQELQNESSVAQAVWEQGRASFQPEGENAGSFDPRTGRTTLPLLDDPELVGARAEYFGGGGQKWVTGIADAAFNIYADPLVLATAGGSKIASAARAVDAVDVAAAANASRLNRAATETVEAGTFKANRFQSAVERTTDRYYDVLNQPGGLAAVAKDPLVSQTTDAGAVAFMMRRAREIGADEADAKSLMDQVIYAGAGDRQALSTLRDRSGMLSLELERMVGPNADTAAAEILGNPAISHKDSLALLDKDTLVQRQVELQQQQIRDELGAIQRVIDSGTGGLGVDAVSATVKRGQAATVRETPGMVAAFRADKAAASVVKTLAGSPALHPVHLVAGRHIPQTLKLSSDDAYEGFEAATGRVERMLRKDKNDAALGQLAEMRDRFVSARSAIDPGLARTQRHEVVRDFNRFAEDYMVVRHGGRNGVSAPEIRWAVRDIVGRRNEEMARLGLSAKQALDAERATTIASDDGIYALTDELARSVATSQFQDVVSVVDWKAVDNALGTRLTPGMIRKTATGAYQWAEAGLASFNDLWKFIALLRPLGYPVRVQVDTQARALAHIGVMRHGLTAMRGMGNSLHNLERVDKAAVELYQQKMLANARLEELDETIPALSGKPLKTAQAERARQQAIVDKTLDDFKAERPDIEGRVRRGSTDLKAFQGSSAGLDVKTGEFTAPSITDPYMGGREAYTRIHDLTDARASILGLMDTRRTLSLRNLRSSGRYALVDSQNPGWADAYLDAVNRHVRNDHVLKSLAGGADDQALLAWMRETPEGREYWAAFATNQKGETKWLSELDLLNAQREHVDALLPTEEIRNRAMAGNLRAEDIDVAFPEGTPRPVVPHNLKEAIDQGNPLVNGYNKARSTYFKFAAEIPETVMGRHPFYRDSFSRRLEDLVSQTGRESTTLTRAEVHQLRNRADLLARRDVARIMFDTSKQSNLGYHMRFLMPFYSAWEDTMSKWARIFGEHWEAAPLMLKAYQAPNKMFEVTDEDGNRILPNGDVVRVLEDGSLGEVIGHEADPTKGYIHIPIPKFLADWAGVDDNVRVSKGSMNVIFQGEPFWLPGPGPLMSIPANEALVQALPSEWAEHPIGKWLLPYGPAADSPAEQALPQWVRNARTAIDQSMNEDRFAQTYAQLLAEEMQAQTTGESEPKTKSETMDLVARRTRNFYIMKAFGSQAPFSTSPQGRLEWYRQEWNRYIEEFGADAEDRFREDYPDYFDMTISLSLNETGVRASDAAMDEVKKYRDLVAQTPEYGWAFAGAANLGGEFSQGAYQQQKRQQIGVGTSKTWRTIKDPGDAYDEVQVSKGWSDWNKFQTMLNLSLDEAQLTIRSKGAEEFRRIRDDFLSELKQENPAWADAYESGFTGDGAVRFLSTMGTAIRDNESLASRSDMKQLDLYLETRKMMRDAMAKLGITSLDSVKAEESGLAEIWAEWVQALAAEDIGFEQIVNRTIAADDLSAEVVIG